MTISSAAPQAAVEQIVLPPVRDLGGGFSVRRALPSAQRRMVGPFIFFDHFGPIVFRAGQGPNIRPHPHIGLSTLSYLFEGEMIHRDSLGHVETIRPGDVNWMTAGGGIVHSERTPDRLQTQGGNLFGEQIWVALPRALEEMQPAFSRHGQDSLPGVEDDGASLTIIAGHAFGERSPVPVFSDLMCVDVVLRAGARMQLPSEHIERALFLISGTIEIVGQDGSFGESQLVVLKPGAEIVVHAPRGAHFMLVGGEPLAEPRHVEWNFVSSSQDRIEQAKQDWREGLFPQIAGETEFIPLPPDPPRVAKTIAPAPTRGVKP